MSTFLKRLVSLLSKSKRKQRRDGIDAMLRYYDWVKTQPKEDQGSLALEMCHQLIIEMANRDYES